MEKYVMSKFANIDDFKNAVMRDGALSDIEKLRYIFSASKESIKRADPQLYYAILAVLDSTKKMAPPTDYFNI